MDEVWVLMVLPPLVEDMDISLTEKVFGALKEGILSLAIRPREYLVIGDVAKHYGTSRTPVREALIMLEREGWVESDGRRGARVIEPSVDIIRDAIEIQMVLEGYVARRATEILTEEEVASAQSILEEAELALKQGDREKSRLLGESFHGYLAGKVGNKRLKKNIQLLQDQIDRVRPMVWQQNDVPVEEPLRQHFEILDAIRMGDAVRAEELMKYHTVWFEQQLSPALKRILG
jgi:GntR family transcriptional regulator, rspAB operon transcriptional repressor